MMDIKKMKSAAIALRDNNCEQNYIEHINQSCPVNVLELIELCEKLQSEKNMPHIAMCEKQDCPSFSECYRAQATPSDPKRTPAELHEIR
jgi:hypothetical protein